MTYSILGDLHTHTLFSRHAYSTITENVAAARETGLEVLGSADHFSAMLCPEQDLRNFQFFINQSVWPRRWDGVLVLRACEVDILGLDGALFGQDIVCGKNITDVSFRRERSLYEMVTRNLDYVVASVHNARLFADATLTQTTDMYLRVLEQPEVFILGHVGRSGVPFDTDEVIIRARDLGKLIEINEHSLDSGPEDERSLRCREIAVRCAELGARITVSSDAHLARAIGQFSRVEQMLEEIRFPEELIANRGKDPLLTALSDAGVCDLLRYRD